MVPVIVSVCEVPRGRLSEPFMRVVIPLMLVACSKTPALDTSKGDAGDDTSSDSGDSGLDGNGPDGGATVDNSCAPDDGAALKFEFGLAHDECGSGVGSTAYLRITLYTPQPGPLPEGRRVTWADELGTGEAVYKASSDEEWLRGESGWMQVDQWREGGDVEGAYEVKLSGGGTISDSFTLPFCDSDVLCG